MTLAPEAMHICIHVFDAGVTVISLGEKLIELCKGFKKIRMMIMWNEMLTARPHLIGIVFIPAFAEKLHRYIFQNKIGKRCLVAIRIGKHDAKPNPLVVFLREFKRDLPMLE